MTTDILMSKDHVDTDKHTSSPPITIRFGRSLGWLLLIALAYCLASFIYAIGIGIYLGATQPEQMMAQGSDMVTAHLSTPDSVTGIYILVFLSVMWVLYKAASFRKQSWHKTLALVAVPARSYLPWLGLFALYYVVATVLNLLVDIEKGEFIGSIQHSRHLGLFFVMVVLAPIVEELVFRGYLFQAWRNSWLGLWGTILLTSVLFTLIHAGQYPALVLGMLFFFSLLLGLAREKTGSVLVTIAMHAVNNFVACVLIVFLGIV